MGISKRTKIISAILKCVVIVAATVGTYLSYTSGMGGFMSGSTIFKYFTIQSNIAIALLSAVGLVMLLRKKPAPNAWYVIHYVGTVSITLTGAVFTFVLAPTLGALAWTPHNILTHVVVPLSAIIDFFLSAVPGNFKRSYVFYVILPPLAYVIYASIGYAAGWEFSKGHNYPYFFLNWGSPAGAFGFSDKLPFMGCFWWILLLTILLLLVGYAYLWLIMKRKKKKLR